MRKLLFVFIILIITSCSKEKAVTATDRMDFSLLEKYDWQQILLTEENHPQDPGQKISYSDTMRYSFAGNNFVYYSQSTMISLKGGGSPGPWEVTLRKQYGKTEGTYQINEADSTLTLQYEAVVGGNLPWGVPGKETDVRLKYKIETLNSTLLKLRSVPSDPSSSLPFLGLEYEYTAIHK